MPRPSTPTILNPEALTALREKDGHSLTTLAALTGYSVGYINDLEKGRRQGNPGVIKKLAVALNVPMAALETRRPELAEDVA